MQNRKPYRLGKTLIVYNFFQVVLSTWLVYEVNNKKDLAIANLSILSDLITPLFTVHSIVLVLYDMEELQLALPAHGLFAYL